MDDIRHIPTLMSFGYLVDHAGKSVVMSGDTKFDENLIKYSMNVDLLLHEVCMLPPALNGVRSRT
jgi:ribonuclease Z